MDVVVPTRGRPAALERCLRALARQTVPVRAIVADDAADPATHDVAGQARPLGLTVEVVSAADRSGPAAMRNLGASAAFAEVVCFTDDDCEPADDWAEALAPAAREAGVAGGLTIAARGATRWARATQSIINALQLHSLDPGSGSLGFAPTSNLAVRRDVLAALPFDESFPSAAGEDREWSARTVADGYPPRYVASALVHHRPDLDARSFVRQQWRYGRGGARYRQTAAAKPELSAQARAPRLAGASAAFQRRLARLAIDDGLAVLAIAELGQALALAGALSARRGRHRR